MKVNWNERDKTKAAYALIVVILSIMFFFALYNFESLMDKVKWFIGVFYPIILGGIFAFLLNMPLSFIEEKLGKLKFYNNLKSNRKRTIAVVLTYILFVLFIILFFSMLIPQLYEALKSLATSASRFVADINTDEIDKLFKNFNINADIVEFFTGKIEKLLDQLMGIMSNTLLLVKNITTGVMNTTIGFLSTTFNFFIGFVISIYILIDKERFGAMSRKISYSIFPTRFSENIIRVVMKINTTMKDYIGGQLVVVTILGIMVAVSLALIGVKGTVAMGFIIAITDLIPYIGPWIGSVPVFLMIVVQDYRKALIFIVIILIAQQIEENILKPRVQSDKLGISSFWILVSIIIGGSLFGIIGMIIGVPIFVVIYQLIKEISEHLLAKRGLPIATDEYLKDENKIISSEGKKEDGILDMNKKSDIEK